MPPRTKVPLALQRFRLATPIGVLVLLQDADQRLRSVDWEDHAERAARLLRVLYGDGGFAIDDGATAPSRPARALERYFAGDRGALDTLPVASSGTGFQRGVWRALRDIPAGTTITYGELARRVGRPKAFRAVGLANGANPIGIVVPCHRVIGRDGSLTGYGGGLERKRWLLAHEGACLP